jgi:DNA mismatch repair ATPase MutS
MRALLLYRDRDADLGRELPANAQALLQDLELGTLLRAMAAGDPFLHEVSLRTLLLSLGDPEEIVYRQSLLSDCQENPTVVRDLYDLAGQALQDEKRVWGSFSRDSPRSKLGTAVQKMDLLVGHLRQVRDLTTQHATTFRSPGLRRLAATLKDELEDEYLELIERYLRELKFKDGLLLSARLTAGNKGAEHTLRRAPARSLVRRVFDRSGYSFTVPDRDQNGFRALGELEDKGVNLVANALMQSLDQVVGFFVMLRTEIGFYVACLNLHDRLTGLGRPVAFPQPRQGGGFGLTAQGLYDVCLALTLDGPVVGNDIAAEDKSLVMITGANQGGKSTLLRALGLAQLMTQAGMFVGGDSLSLNLCDGLYTHFKREEDSTLESGKLDEELARMSQIVTAMSPRSILLCNESFASTNEREGSEIARQVIQALLAAGVRVAFVTHLFDLAAGLHELGDDSFLFLRAEAGTDGARPYRLNEGAPLPTSYGGDSFRHVFGRSADTHPTPSPTRAGLRSGPD